MPTRKFSGSIQSTTRDIVEGKGAINSISTGIDRIVASQFDREANRGQRKLDKSINKLSGITGLNLSTVSLSEVLTDPQAALNKVLRVGKTQKVGGWTPLLRARPDPLYEVDWYPQLPFDLPAEYVEEIQLSAPELSTGAPIYVAGRFFTLPETYNVNQVVITFYEDRLMTVNQWWQKWRDAMTPEKGNGQYMLFNYPASYLKPIYLFVKDITGKTVGQYCMHGCFPVTSPQMNFSVNSDRIRPQISFACQWIDFQVTAGATDNKGKPAKDNTKGTVGDLSKGLRTVVKKITKG